MADQKVNIKVSTTGAKKAKDQLGGVTGAVTKMGRAVGIASAAYFGAKGLIEGLSKSIELAGKSDAVEKGFDNLAKKSGFSANAFKKFQDATNGTVGSLELMTQANNAMLLGITDSEDQMAEMFDVAQRLASALGQDTAFGVESLVTGLGRQSKLMLDNLGIMVDVEAANNNYANTLGIANDKLTDQQKKQAFVNESMRVAKELVKGLGEEQTTVNDATSKVNASFEILSTKIGKKLAPLVKILAEDLSTTALKLGNLIEPDVVSRQDQLNALLEQFFEIQSEGSGALKDTAVTVEELFGNFSDLEKIDPFAIGLDNKQIDAATESLRKQIETFKDLLFEKKADLTLKEIDIPLIGEIKKLEVDSTVAQINARSKLINLKKEQIRQDLRGAALSGQNAKDAMKSVVRAETMEAVSGYIAQAFKSFPFPINLILAAGAGGAVASVMDAQLAKFADGGIVQGDPSKGDSVPAMLTAGEVILNQAQQDNLVGNMGGVTINIEGNMIGNEEFVRDTLIPEVQKVSRENLA